MIVNSYNKLLYINSFYILQKRYREVNVEKIQKMEDKILLKLLSLDVEFITVLMFIILKKYMNTRKQSNFQNGRKL